MKVQDTYTRSVVSTRQSDSLGAAAALMRKHNVGALLVTGDAPNDRCAIGIVTDRDIVLHALAEGELPVKQCVGDVMTPSPQSVPVTADLHQAVEVMRLGGFRRLAVTDETGDIVGVLSLDDVICALAAEFLGVASLLQSERDLEHRKQLDLA